jgi:acetyltransferase
VEKFALAQHPRENTITSPQKAPDTLAFNPNLHGFRGIAALAVLLFHWGSSIGFFPQARQHMTVTALGSKWDLGMALDFGWLGVPLFFVLSGYLLTSQLLTRDLNGQSIPRFWLRRGMRIYPAFWLQLLVLLIAAKLFAFMPQLTSTTDILRHVFLWINLPPWMTAPMNAVWWTLPVELSFYLLLPLLVLIARRIGWLSLLLGAIVLTISWRYGVMSVYAGSNYSTHLAVLDAIPGSLSTFCCGMALAYLIASRGVPAGKSRALMLISGIATFYAMLYWLRSNIDTYWTGHWMLGVWNPIMGVIITGILLSLIRPLRGFKWLGSAPMVWLGNISFGIYLWHYPLLMLLQRTILQEWTTPWLNTMALLVTLAGTAVLASLSYYLLEKPIMSKR